LAINPVEDDLRHLKAKFGLVLAAASMTGANAFACGPIEGTYVLKNFFAPDNTLEVTRDANGYRYSLDLYYANQKNDGSLTSMGMAEGPLSVANCQATGHDPDNECSFSFAFKRDGTVSILQLDSCMTFGHSVDATGLYTKTARPPDSVVRPCPVDASGAQPAASVPVLTANCAAKARL
jgi:hypothetical protein